MSRWTRRHFACMACQHFDMTLELTLSSHNRPFAEAREKGLVHIHAVAIASGKTAATVCFAKYAHEEVQGWNQGMKLSISQPLLRAKTFGTVRGAA
jgi:hypothetical protein